MPDLFLVTCHDLPEPDHDAEPLARALDEAGITARVEAWDDPAVDWTAARLTVLRSTWNYHLRRQGFLAWAEQVAAVSQLINPLAAVRWNSHKRYLLELQERGLPVTPTLCLDRGREASLATICREQGWDEVVVKPAVSASSYRTLRLGRDDLRQGQRHLQQLLAEGDVLVQAYLPAVEGYGERALVWIDGELTHAVRKSPRFARDEEAVSGVLPVAEAEAGLAHRALAAVDTPLLYARVDLAPGPTGQPLLMELELVEPSLFFPQSPAALERFVAAIARRLGE
jgi:hypothetical protein